MITIAAEPAVPPASAILLAGLPSRPQAGKSIGTSAKLAGRKPPVGPEGQIALSGKSSIMPPHKSMISR
jgi:hypothetical protein